MKLVLMNEFKIYNFNKTYVDCMLIFPDVANPRVHLGGQVNKQLWP